MSSAFLKEILSALFMYILIEFSALQQLGSKPLSSWELYGVYEQDGRKFPSQDENEAQLPQVITRCMRRTKLNVVRTFFLCSVVDRRVVHNSWSEFVYFPSCPMKEFVFQWNNTSLG